ncbi:hypothetical protein RRG08_032516 [Elysia crispata]|uniref:Uncharacterized protein n=1 Tax=Elysia crispata TaxID=231223 RepID=A0AAE0ZY42_9GAST|nr:hypothetical protein RRG08_032516 [Elysia crispata]
MDLQDTIPPLRTAWCLFYSSTSMAGSTIMAGHGPSRHNTTFEDGMMPILQLYQHGRAWTVKTQYHL